MTTSAQLELPVYRSRTATSRPERLAMLLARLQGRRWQSAKDLQDSFHDRELRTLAESSDGQIISGQRGYCLITEATPDEIRHSADSLRSRARKILARHLAIRRRAHAIIR